MSEPHATPAQRREVHYRGHVQGVGFRDSVRHMASRFRVVGFVRNLPDGRVRLVAEGEPEELDGFHAAVSDRMSNYIREAVVDVRPANGEFQDFAIRY